MQKALTQMNLQLHHVLSDLTGVTGMAIVRDILAGCATRARWRPIATAVARPVNQRLPRR
jgi:hypothetical protein